MEETDLHASRSDDKRRTLGARSTSAVTSSHGVGGAGGRGSDGACTGSASLVDQGGAGATGAAGCLGGGGAVEVAGVLAVALLGLLLVVEVHGVGELLLGGADAVGAEFTRGGVALDAVADLVAADGAEELVKLLAGHVVLELAGQALLHAGAEILVRGRGQRAGLREPTVADGGTRLEGSVGWRVVVLLGAGGRGTGQLLGQVAVVFTSLDLVAVDRHETWMES